MRLFALPPVRRPVPLRRGNPETRLDMERFFGNREITLYTSGTAALAHAIAECAARSPTNAPEVIIPAYGCPDLVAACVHASVYPRLVDVASSRWSYDFEALNSSLSPNTVAIVAVNLLGLGDDAVNLTRLCEQWRIPLIQDSAQYLPRVPIEWPGDYVVLSFGRGKPMNLLHGGALVAPAGNRRAHSTRSAHYTGKDRLLAGRTAAVAFNVLTRPHIYRLLSALPGTGLGEVVYKPPANTALLPEQAWKRVGIAFELYRQKPSYRRDIWSSALQEWSRLGVIALDGPAAPPPAEPLRLALLAPDRAARDLLVDNLNRAGLGASRFYAAELTEVAGIPDAVRRQAPLAHARALADRLFTLPSHGLVTADAVASARKVVLAWRRSDETSRGQRRRESLTP